MNAPGGGLVTGRAAVPDPGRGAAVRIQPGGDSHRGRRGTPGKMGHVTLRALTEAGFPGRLYPVNPGGGTVSACPPIPG